MRARPAQLPDRLGQCRISPVSRHLYTAVATHIATRVLAISVAAALSACVFVPRTVQVYDFDCGVMVNHLVLEGGQVAAIQHCENQGCLALIVGASVVTAATVVVSGSIVVVGNVASWLERKARCPPSSISSVR